MRQIRSRTTHTLSLLTLVAAIAGCGGGSDTGAQVSIAFTSDAQSPDPVVVDFPVAYVSRALSADRTLTRSARSLDVFEPGASLILKDRAEPSAPEFNLLDIFEADANRFDVRDLAADYDGSRLLFSMRGPFLEDADDDEQPSWNIWIYDLEQDVLRRVIESDTLAEAGHDRDPHFLPDGRIVFTSDRQRRARAILLDEGRPQFAALDEDRDEPAFVLHTMNDDGTDIEQISFNQSHDQDPTVDFDGHIIFSRWDNVPGRDAISLYRIEPDGQGLQRLYGYNSQNTGPGGARSLLLEPAVMEDGSLLVEAISEADADIAMTPLLVDASGHADENVPVFSNLGDAAPGQTALFDTLALDDAPSLAGRFADATPLYDGTGRILAIWSQCRLTETLESGEARVVPCSDAALEAGLPEAAPLYGLWMFDPAEETQQPVVPPVEGRALIEAVVLEDRALPFVRQTGMQDTATLELIDANMGILDIRSVYDIDGADASPAGIETTANPVLTPAAVRPYTFVRLVKPVSQPPREVREVPGTAFGRSRGELMREILGYGLVHPDGSVRMQVPANIPFAISLVDADGKRVSPRHRNWLQVRAGETLSCNGCHDAGSDYPHGRPDAEAPSINPGAPWPGLAAGFAVDAGDTIAAGFAALNEVPGPAANPSFTDVWTDSEQRAPDAAFALRYQDLSTPAPASAACIENWQASCRATIHYPTHIHPIWSVPRITVDAEGEVIADHTCTACHSPLDAMDAARVPAAQLDLSGGASPDQADHLVSYRELLFGDVEQEVVNGALIDRLVPVFDGDGNPVIERDDEGEPILDADGNTIPVLTTVPVRPVLSTGGALASPNFFNRFGAGGTHADYLTPAEIRLLAEWLDVGGQYYNDPFAVPP